VIILPEWQISLRLWSFSSYTSQDFGRYRFSEVILGFLITGYEFKRMYLFEEREFDIFLRICLQMPILIAIMS
jgi:hypothetical protein